MSSWNTRCGIAAYSAYLTEHFDTEVQVYASRRTREEELDKLLLPADGESVVRCWSSGFGDDLSELREALFADLPGSVVIQFNYGFFEFPALSDLILALKAAGVVVVVMFHSTCDPPELPERRLELLAQALSECDRLLVHSPGSESAEGVSLVDNTMLLPHGVLISQVRVSWLGKQTVSNPSSPFQSRHLDFLLPSKGSSNY